jgi:hypothetical protein
MDQCSRHDTPSVLSATLTNQPGHGLEPEVKPLIVQVLTGRRLGHHTATAKRSPRDVAPLESTDDRSSWRRAGAQSSTAVLLALDVGVQGRIERSDRLSELSGRATEPFGLEPATELDQPSEKITHVPQVSQHRV